MTIREHLYRRWRWPIYSSIAAFSAFVAVALLGNETTWAYVAIPLLIGFLALLWVPFFTMRCPRCRVRLSGLSNGLFSKRKSRHFKYCPGCVIDLESPA